MQRSLIFNDVTLKWIEHIKLKFYNIWSFPKKKKKKRCSSFKGDNSMSVIIYLVWQENKKKLT